jgi:hypothetical protein
MSRAIFYLFYFLSRTLNTVKKKPAVCKRFFDGVKGWSASLAMKLEGY